MPRPAPAWLRALGPTDLPRTLHVGGNTYVHAKTFKHDFFAATGLYQGPAGKVVLKVGRQSALMGLPLDWIGRLLARHEIRLFRTVQSIEGVPRLVGTWGVTGLVHEYVEGRPLAKGDSVDDRFFPRLADMLRQMHAAGVAYVDLEKRENILLRDDGGPALIDFQISWHLPANRGGKTSVNRLILHVLQQSDQYHLLKHWRRLKPEQLASEELARSFKAPFWIRWHRAVFRPFTQLRRRVLVLLGARESASGRSPG